MMFNFEFLVFLLHLFLRATAMYCHSHFARIAFFIFKKKIVFYLQVSRWLQNAWCNLLGVRYAANHFRLQPSGFFQGCLTLSSWHAKHTLGVQRVGHSSSHLYPSNCSVWGALLGARSSCQHTSQGHRGTHASQPSQGCGPSRHPKTWSFPNRVFCF